MYLWHNQPELAVSSSGEAHLVWWASDAGAGNWQGDWATVHYWQLQVDDENLTLTDTVQLSPGDGTGDDVAKSPHVTLDESGGVHVVWFGDESYRACQSGNCNSGGWSTPEALPAQAPDRALDLVVGRDTAGTPVLHLMANQYYSKRPLGCQSDCWLTPTIDVRPLADFTSFSSVHLATARDGRPQLVVRDGALGGQALYYLDLTQGAVSYYYAPSASSGQAVAQRIDDVLGETSRVYYLHYDGASNPSTLCPSSRGLPGQGIRAPNVSDARKAARRCRRSPKDPKVCEPAFA